MDKHTELTSIARKRGLYWPSYEIYGGVAGLYDYGPVGVRIKSKIIDMWRRFFVDMQRGLVVEIETPIITPRIVLKASGHEDHFTDPYTYCKKCGNVYRVDHLIKEKLGLDVEGLGLDELWEIMKKHGLRCPRCGGELSRPEHALLLFRTTIGPYRGTPAYFRPETAQGMFVSFKHVYLASRERFPLGIAQIGKVGRNEISPRQGLIRLREFTIMEIEFFFDPAEPSRGMDRNHIRELMETKLRIVTASARLKGSNEPITLSAREAVEKGIIETPWLAYWMAVGTLFLEELGIPHEKIRFMEKLPHEKAHYAAQTFDQEVYTEKYGWVEVAGYAYRTNYDLTRHIEYSKADLTVFKRYPQPRRLSIRKAYPDINAIRRDYPDRLADIMKDLGKISREELAAIIEEKGGVKAGGVFLDRKYFVIKSEEKNVYGEKIIPHVVEPSFGLERVFYAVLENSYEKIEGRNKLRLPPSIAPYDVAVFPLVTGTKKEHKAIEAMARAVYDMLIEAGFDAIYDADGSIGRRYARADEIGIPYAITVDYQTLEDKTVTIRERDTQRQQRIHIESLYIELAGRLSRVPRWEELVKKYLSYKT